MGAPLAVLIDQAKLFLECEGWITAGVVQRRLRVTMRAAYFLVHEAGGPKFPRHWLPT